MKIRQAIAAAAVITACTLGTVSTQGTASASAPAATTTTAQVQGFWQFMHDLQQYPYSCTAYHSNIVGNGVFGGVQNVTETPIYEGTCLQSFLLVLDYDATFYTVNTNNNPDA